MRYQHPALTHQSQRTRLAPEYESTHISSAQSFSYELGGFEVSTSALLLETLVNRLDILVVAALASAIIRTAVPGGSLFEATHPAVCGRAVFVSQPPKNAQIDADKSPGNGFSVSTP